MVATRFGGSERGVPVPRGECWVGRCARSRSGRYSVCEAASTLCTGVAGTRQRWLRVGECDVSRPDRRAAKPGTVTLGEGVRLLAELDPVPRIPARSIPEPRRSRQHNPANPDRTRSHLDRWLGLHPDPAGSRRCFSTGGEFVPRSSPGAAGASGSLPMATSAPRTSPNRGHISTCGDFSTGGEFRASIWPGVAVVSRPVVSSAPRSGPAPQAFLRPW